MVMQRWHTLAHYAPASVLCFNTEDTEDTVGDLRGGHGEGSAIWRALRRGCGVAGTRSARCAACSLAPVLAGARARWRRPSLAEPHRTRRGRPPCSHHKSPHRVHRVLRVEKRQVLNDGAATAPRRRTVRHCGARRGDSTRSGCASRHRAGGAARATARGAGSRHGPGSHH